MTETRYRVEDLAAIGQTLYGERWQTDLARDLGLADARRVRQWMSRDRPIPPGIWPELLALLEQRGERALELARALRDRDTQQTPKTS